MNSESVSSKMVSNATPVTLLDGGLGTTLEDEHGIKFSSATTPLWSSHLLLMPTGQETLRECHRSFLRAGAEVLKTATYQVSIEGFARTKTDEWPDGVPRAEIPKFLDVAIKVAEDAAAEHAQRADARTESASKAKIALALGPYGACMIPSQEYSGKYDAEHETEESLIQWHAERLALFEQVDGIESRISYIAIETIPRRDEIRAIRKALAASKLRDVPLWVSGVYPGEGPAARSLADGTPYNSAVVEMLSLNTSDAVPFAVGMNCSNVEKLQGLVRPYERAVQPIGGLKERPALVLYPNGSSDELYDSTTQTWQRRTEGEKNGDEVGSFGPLGVALSAIFIG
jgi:homocysteine S-methyltransferase